LLSSATRSLRATFAGAHERTVKRCAMRAHFAFLCLFQCFLCEPIVSIGAAELQAISLPSPRQHGGKPLMEALKERKTSREFAPGELAPQLLADLLWASFGINRPENDHRTAPSAMNSQEIDLYVALPSGLFLYSAKSNRLEAIKAGDFRPKTSSQPFLKDVAAVLIYVADLPRLAKAKPETRSFYAAFDAGCICQNVYLFCASARLATVVYDLNRPPLAEAMGLRPEQQIIFAQAVGFPKAP